MNILPIKKRVSAISALVEGCSVRSTVRMTGVAKGTILKLLAQVGEACLNYQDSVLRNLPCKRIECDEIWAFCYAKDKNLPDAMRGEPGVGTSCGICGTQVVYYGRLEGSRHLASSDVAGASPPA